MTMSQFGYGILVIGILGLINPRISWLVIGLMGFLIGLGKIVIVSTGYYVPGSI
jgi:hypothetical protein